ncbi:PREDICTED: protein FAR1-RELATED SEQUENCE 5-like [Ipomoea nil]|uniref:protein FAR1-RELATED SEQUENCE 5-like n=1 Tax=Ipomoea nil TaxID=35883 RepID=UPI0009012CBE|nr:PREDICTED: protein FAR1-RELATED SEQUENCE 5-like [Ipomoea nil]
MTTSNPDAGGVKGLRFCKEKTGSYANIGATDVEFHNFKRDVQTYVDVADGEMIIATFKAKHEACSDFFFEYDLDEEHRVSRLFWADPLSRRKFSCYGDNISFDATYGTNRYSMVFVPFTGVDNHKRCITFGAGLLIKEDADSYSWLLEQFICAMGKRPVCVVTDQDPAMRIAIERVLPECHHRYCMWHIMTKVNEKLVSELAKDNEFRKKLNAIIWNETIDRVEFEAQWQLLMDEYNLSTYRWFCKILVEFYMQFESVLRTQRYRQDKLNAQCEGYLPEFKTPLALERHIAQLFMITIFYELQKEIEAACFYCSVVGVRQDGNSTYYDIDGECAIISTVHYKGLTAKFASDGISVNPVKGNRAAIQALCGVEPPQSITIQAPALSRKQRHREAH